MAPTQKYYRGFFSGGTLADESMKLSIGKLGHIYSNIPLKPEDKIENPLTAEYKENTCIDFGEDEFTEGKPHPMIDLTLRCERILIPPWLFCSATALSATAPMPTPPRSSPLPLPRPRRSLRARAVTSPLSALS